MRLLKAKHLWIGGIIILGSLSPGLLHASDSYWSVTRSASVEIIPLNVSVHNDSVTLHWKIVVSDIRVRRNYSHVLVPLLTDAHHSFSLPFIVISGRKRASYDIRERALDPFQRKPYSVWVYHRRRPVEPIYYSVSFPYAAWMEHCSLELRQVSQSANHSVLLSSERLCNDFLRGGDAAAQADSTIAADSVKAANALKIADALKAADALIATNAAQAADNAAQAANAAAQAADSLRSVRVALFLAYPSGYSGINALFSDNAAELAKVDRLLLPLLNDPHQQIRRIRVTGYSSPDGVYIDNELLAQKRAQAFVRYLRAAYPLPPGTTVRTAWVAEDWEGLREQLRQLDIPYRNRALSLIDRIGIFDGREHELMLLDNGNLYRYLKQTIFPKLRRIEVEIEVESLPREAPNNQPK